MNDKLIVDHHFLDIPVIGAQDAQHIARQLEEVGDEASAEQLRGASKPNTGTGDNFGSLLFGSQPKPWQHTSHAYGYLSAGSRQRNRKIEHAGNIQADTSLKNRTIKITLDQLCVAEYPGSGLHHILFDFYAQNQTPKTVEHVHFNAMFHAQEGQQAAIVGHPIFVGLNTGTQGVAFSCFTVNVKNKDDEKFLRFLDSDVFRTGLTLASVAQPAIAPLTEVIHNLTRFVAKRHRNIPVQRFTLGLDFSDVTTRAKLATGSYIVAQVPQSTEHTWSWGDWVYQTRTGQIVSRTDPESAFPHNYIVFGVSRHEI